MKQTLSWPDSWDLRLEKLKIKASRPYRPIHKVDIVRVGMRWAMGLPVPMLLEKIEEVRAELEGEETP